MAKLGYISVNLDKEQEKALSKDITALGLNPISEYDFHVTLMFDERECDEKRCIINDAVIYEATVTGFQALGKSICMNLYSRGLYKEFTRLVEAGYEHSFDGCHLHMSLVYKPNELELEVIKTGLDHWLGETLRFSNETVRDCD